MPSGRMRSPSRHVRTPSGSPSADGVERRQLGPGGRDWRGVKLCPDLPVADLAAAGKGQYADRGLGAASSGSMTRNEIVPDSQMR